jgi:hypothetical protein
MSVSRSALGYVPRLAERNQSLIGQMRQMAANTLDTAIGAGADSGVFFGAGRGRFSRPVHSTTLPRFLDAARHAHNGARQGLRMRRAV